MKNFIIPSLLTIVLTIILSLYLIQLPFMPELASQQGGATDALLRPLYIMTAFFFSLVVSFLGYSLIVFRRRPGDIGDAHPFYNNNLLEVVWTAVPLFIVLGLAVYGAKELIAINHPPPHQEEIIVNVDAFQWGWSFYYPNTNITSPKLYLPVNQPIRFRVTTRDVNHSFWIPEFRLKIDAIPGKTNELRITPTQVGTYTIHCAELCGTAHAFMMADAIVVQPEEFQSWMQSQQMIQNQGDTATALAQQSSCLGCHSTDGSRMAGPTFKGLYQSQVSLEDGQTVGADDDYLHRSIVDPEAQIVQGFPNIMPKNFGQLLSEAQIQTLIEYIKGVK